MAVCRIQSNGLGSSACLLLLLAAITITLTNGKHIPIKFPGVGDADCPFGRCLPAADCHVTPSEAAPCGFQGHTPFVCCPPQPHGSENTSESSSVSSPVIDFECGRLAGRSASRDHPRARRAVGGAPVSASTSWPWAALLGVRGQDGEEVAWRCVGSLVHPQWVLTALHCFWNDALNLVRLGEHDYSDPDDGAIHHDIEIGEVVFHPDFVYPQSYHDLALIKLARPVPLQDTIMPVCLPWGREMQRDLIGRNLTLTGWGVTQFGGMRSPVLQEVNMTLFPAQMCNETYRGLLLYANRYPRGIDDSFLCLGHPDGGKSACQGDSGGPLVYQEGGLYLLAGAVSRGYGCGHPLYPGVHTNLRRQEHLQWLRDSVWPLAQGGEAAAGTATARR